MSTETPSPTRQASSAAVAEPSGTEVARPNPNGGPSPTAGIDQALGTVPLPEAKCKEPRNDSHDSGKTPSRNDFWQGLSLFAIVLLVLGLTAYVVIDGLQSSNRTYRAVVQLAQDYAEHSRDRPGYRPDLALHYMTQIARVQDQVFLKWTALLLGMAVVLVGFVFVWIGTGEFSRISTQTSHTHTHSHIRSAMQTTSPGLVLIGIGAALVVAMVLVPLHLETRFDWDESSQATAAVPALSAYEVAPPLQVAPPPSEANKAYQKSLERSGRADR